MADRLCIDKCVVAAQLLKAAYIVQDAGQPRQIDILRRQSQALGNAGTERRHAVGMVDFQFDLGVSGVVVRGIVGKGFCARARSIFILSLPVSVYHIRQNA